uniref:Transmembrane protein 18 n=1 Tax=Pyramimonas obovata TaxID=1411642 RepID=A0A7S0QXK4_9CHLO|mmetsp:Transcript_16126/g.35041  ORF Transcript_16126/g.35041 Transcript_16126/m.35041 type:complete len:174 (+) Transcript_16126:129-650(+)|eukprot:CAMPEP_0118934116 /NCGR_PEP_ID=MMETSP1169-20130426/13649_1 /TAXON_ID=36882 /ORGANISM="Pyramimonas obovata, Strain CCMP722" /LENGTH=173 /DNA_ID=CAMNT_0006876987 /DNA_START=129 /DNA_END=650 /DNA_ORIENTATION=+
MAEWGPLIDGFASEVRKVIKEHNEGVTSLKASFLAFVHAVDWKEPWIIGLLGWHLMMFLIIIATRNNSGMHSMLFFLLLGLIYMAEPINDIAGDYWQLFAGQPYFDKHGLFMSSVFSGPIMINVLVVTGFSLYNMTQMMVKVKRAQVQRQQKAAEKAESKSKDKSKSGSKKKN